MSDTFVWGEVEHHLLENFQASPARPSGKSRIKIWKHMKKDGRIMTIIAWNKGRENLHLFTYINPKEVLLINPN